MKNYRSLEMKKAYEMGGYREHYAMDYGNKSTVYVNSHKCFKFTYSKELTYQDGNGAMYDTFAGKWID